MVDYSRFEQDVLDLVSRAHGLSVRQGRSEVDSIAMLAVLCDGSVEVVNRLLGWANVQRREVARIIAGIYRQFGALKKGHLVEVDRSRLVAGYVGQSEEKTQAVVDAALDGVLFIDEAYALAQGGGSDYGAAVASVLVKRMEDDRERLVVIAAGYADEMAKFIGMNPGFASRFTKTIDFPDYTGEELTKIFESMAKAEGYECSAKVLETVRDMMDDVASWGGRVSGNARNVRNLLKAAKERMAKRVLAAGRLTKEKLRRIEVEDVMPC